jgi:aspartate aminotransferase
MQAFDSRRRFLVEQISPIEGLELAPPQGAFYALVDARALCSRLDIDDIELARRLLEQQGLAVVPGSPFAIEGFIRLSYAASMEELEKAMVRLRRFVKEA